MSGTGQEPVNVAFRATPCTRRKLLSESLAHAAFLLMASLMVVPLVLIVAYLFYQAWPILSLDFLDRKSVV